jgi:hypothetical protein
MSTAGELPVVLYREPAAGSPFGTLDQAAADGRFHKQARLTSRGTRTAGTTTTSLALAKPKAQPTAFRTGSELDRDRPGLMPELRAQRRQRDRAPSDGRRGKAIAPDLSP